MAELLAHQRDGRTLRTLVLKLGCFTPVMLPVILALLALYGSGELDSVTSVVSRQHAANLNYLYGTVYSSQTVYFKKCLAIANTPQVMALGTSRVMQIRSCMFQGNAPFFNAGGAVSITQQIIPFLESLPPGGQPKVILLGLDQNFFNDTWRNRTPYNRNEYGRSLEFPDDREKIINSSYQTVIRDFLKGKVLPRRLLSKQWRQQKIGMRAMMKDDGFRNDGSYQFGSLALPKKEQADYQFSYTFSIMRRGSDRFEHGSTVSLAGLQDVADVLDYCCRKGLHVVGFLPPYAPGVVMKMNEMGSRYQYVWLINSQVAPLFRHYGHSFFDFTSMPGIPCTDNEFIDGYHGSDVIYAKLLSVMAEADMVLARYVNRGGIERMLASRVNDVMLLDDRATMQ